MPCPRRDPLPNLTLADHKALLAERGIEERTARQAELEANLRRVQNELARLVKAAIVAKPAAPSRTKRAAAMLGAWKTRMKAAVTNAAATGRPLVESVNFDQLKANGAPMAIPEILATIKKQKLAKTKSASFTGVVRRMIFKSSHIENVERGSTRPRQLL